MFIRTEKPADYRSVYFVVKSAFDSAEQKDGNEQDLVNDLRKSTAFVPELSLVAEENGKIIGHIMFTKLKIGEAVILALAPLSVLPQYQRQGVGTALVNEGHKIAKDLGYSYSVFWEAKNTIPGLGMNRPKISAFFLPSMFQRKTSWY